MSPQRLASRPPAAKISPNSTTVGNSMVGEAPGDLIDQADVNFTTEAAEGLINQAELDKLSKLSAESWMIVSDPDFDALNGSEDPIMGDIASKIAEERSGEALELYKNWKTVKHRRVPEAGLADRSNDGNNVEDYSDNFSGDVDLLFSVSDNKSDAKTYVEYDPESSSRTALVKSDGDNDFEPCESDSDSDSGVEGSDFTISSEGFLSLNLRSAVTGDIYDYVEGPVAGHYSSQALTCQCAECMLNEMDSVSVVNASISRDHWSATDSNRYLANMTTSNISEPLPAAHALFNDSDISMGAVTAGLPVIIITSHMDTIPDWVRYPVRCNMEHHPPCCECYHCSLRRKEVITLGSGMSFQVTQNDISIGAVAAGLPPIVISDHDRDREMKWMHTYLKGAKFEPTSRAVARILADTISCRNLQSRTCKIDESNSEERGSEDTRKSSSGAEKDEVIFNCTDAFPSFSLKSTQTRQIRTGADGEYGGRPANMIESQEPTANQCVRFQAGHRLPAAYVDVIGIFKKVTIIGVVIWLLTAFVPKSVLAAVIVGMLLIGR